jgi:[ribosomal protein S5]-alanine N-acetyltransferase
MQLVLERPWRLDDADSLAKHANDRKVWLGLRDLFPHLYTMPDAHQFLQQANKRPVHNEILH